MTYIPEYESAETFEEERELQNMRRSNTTAKRNLEFELSKLISTFMQDTNQNVKSVDVTIRPMLGYSSCRMVEIAAKVNLTETPILSIEYSQP